MHFVLPHRTMIDANGVPMVGAKLYVYQSGTTTAATTWANLPRTVINPTPVVADAEGILPPVWLAPGSYGIELRTASDELVSAVDPVQGEPVAAVEVATIADLQILPTRHAYAHVLGYHAANDCGGGFFYWDAAETAVIDGGMVIASSLDSAGRWIRVVDAERLDARWFGAKGDGATDDTAALQAAIDAATARVMTLFLPSGTFHTSATLNVTCSVVGEEGGTGYNNSTFPRTKLVKTNGNTNGNVVLSVSESLTLARIWIATARDPDYALAFYPTTPAYDVCPDVGIVTAKRVRIENIAVSGFRLYGLEAGLSAHVIASVFSQCGVAGVRFAGNDGVFEGNTVRHNSGDGVLASATFWRVVNNRIEWNSGAGLVQDGAEFTISANLFDRNGGPGLKIGTAWGGTVVGNYFCRNGAAGNGTVGRWHFSATDDPSYRALPKEESAHIYINSYQRAITITGNRYRYGTDDNNGGASAPAHIYSISGTAPSYGFAINDNAGEFWASTNSGEAAGAVGAGFDANYPGGGSLYAGAQPDFTAEGRYRAIRGHYVTTLPTLVIRMNQENDVFGQVLINWTRDGDNPGTGVASVTFLRSTAGGNAFVIEDVLGVATLAGGAAPGDELTVTFDGPKLRFGMTTATLLKAMSRLSV
ncbi:glycosyl hydrolase family 28-related protein [uncultured Tistrella sp.]|uniref:glycosyl hydrolase family 28-related protein n=1 Tax=Tistrella mobilis TaxID=171437 RepID=UPI00262897F8|nr:glycosyl hydrolase family 28-related protein [uncultured Tistrella sp.]